MTLRFTAEEPDPKSLISATEALYQDLADEIFQVLRKLKAGEWDPKGTTHSVKEMRSTLRLVLEERMKIAELGKRDAGAAYDHALDFDAARAEIGRRLACLRDAGND